jgi:hypothetical protein
MEDRAPDDDHRPGRRRPDMPTDRPALPSLLDRLGGPGALWTAVEAAVARASADPELSEHAIEIVTGSALDEHVASLVQLLGDRGPADLGAALEAADAERLATHLADALSLIGVAPMLAADVRERLAGALADSSDGRHRHLAVRRPR